MLVLPKNMIIAYIAFFLSFVISTSILSASCIKGTSVIKTDEYEEVEEASDEHIIDGKKKAVLAAWKYFIHSLDGDQFKAYELKKNIFLKNLGFYISNYNEAGKREFSESEQTLKTDVCLNIDSTRILQALNIKKKQPIVSGAGSAFTALFIARQAQTAETFDVNRKKNSKSLSKAKSKQISQASDGKALVYNADVSKQKSETGGSTIRKSDNIKYKIISDDDFNTAVSGQLTNAGYEWTPYGELVGAADECGQIPSAETVSSIFKSKNKMAGRHWNQIRKAARRCDFKFFARGSMTVDAARNYRGRRMVSVRVNVAVYDVSKRFSRKVSAVQKQWSGLGTNEKSARTNALMRAGKMTGQIIAKELQKKGLK